MKPTINTLGCGNKEVVVVYQKEALKKTKEPKKRKSWKITSMILIGFILMAIATFVIFTINHTHYKGYWAFYHLDNGMLISQQITLSESEEDITVPGKVRVIFDFEHELLVMRLSDKQVCFVSEYNTTDLATPRQVNKQLQAIERHHHINTTVTQTNEMHVRATEIEVDIDILSPRSKQMCYEHKVYRMEITQDASSTRGGNGHREKRYFAGSGSVQFVYWQLSTMACSVRILYQSLINLLQATG